MRSTLWWVVFAVMTISNGPRAQQQVVVPAFFAISTQSDPSKPRDWTRIVNAGAAVKIVVALGDPGGFETCGPTTCSVTDAQNQFNANHGAGQLVFGYVNTQFATVADIFGDPSSGIGINAWYSRYANQIQGIFLDNGPSFGQSSLSEQTFQNYYESNYVRAHGYPYYWQVMINASGFPGTTNTAQPQDWILTGCSNCSPAASPAADHVNVWEQAMSQYYGTAFKAIGPGGVLQDAPGWWASHPGHVSHIIHDATQLDVDTAVYFSRNRVTPFLYIFDTPAGNHHYDHVACFFEQEVAAVYNNQPSNNSGKTMCPQTGPYFTPDAPT